MVLAACSMGYAVRVEHPRELLLPGMSAEIEDGLIRKADGTLDLAALNESPEHLRRLFRFCAVWSKPAALLTFSGCHFDVWRAMSATLGHSIQTNARQTGVSKRDMLSLDEIDDMLRVGYCLRVIDEVAGEEPGH